MKISINELEKLLVSVAEKFVSEEEALYFAKEEIDTHLKKYPRTNPLGEAVKDIEAWTNNPKSNLLAQVDKRASLLLNFNRLAPSLKIKYIHDELEKRAKKYGISMVGINNSHGLHTLNLWTDGLGKRDLIGICVFNGGPDGVVPYGGTRGIFGTNPLAYAVPTQGDPIIVDMATSEIPYFEIRNAKKNNIKLKENSAVDQMGESTVDPQKAMTDEGISNLLPMGGGYKGYALVLLIEILTGSLVRSFLSTEMTPKYVNEEHGGLLIAIDIGSFTDIRKFKKSVSEMCDTIRLQKPSKNLSQITVPGDRSYQRQEKALKSGKVEIDGELIKKLKIIIRE